MGRKPVNKERKKASPFKKEWAQILLPHIVKAGIKELNMVKVAQILDKSKATVYSYFQSKEEILEMMLKYKLDELSKFEAILTDYSIPYMDRYIECVKFMAHEMADVSGLFLSDLKKFHPRLWRRILSFQKRIEKVFRVYYQEGIDQGHLRPIPISLLILTDKFFFDSILQPEFLLESGLTLQEAFVSYFEMKCMGMVKDPRPSRQAFSGFS